MSTKRKILIHKVVGVFLLIISYMSLYAQSVENETIQLSTLPKVIMFVFTFAGIFLGYIQLKMSIKLASLEAKFVSEITAVKMEVEFKIKEAIKEIDIKMATSKDIDNIEKMHTMYHKSIMDKIRGLEKQLDMAANIYKGDKKEGNG